MPSLDASNGDRASRLYQEAPCGLALLDNDGLFIDANGTFLSWFGYDASDLFGRRRFQDLLNAGGRIYYQTHVAPLLGIQGSVAEVKLDIKRGDGVILPILINFQDHATEEGTLRQVAVFIATDRVKYERELLLARQRAEELAKQQGAAQQELELTRALAEDRALVAEQMMAIVGHDLRTPLTAILLGADSVRRDPINERQERVLSQMGTAVRRCTRLITDLLDFTQARVGHGLRINPTLVDIHACVREGLEELRLALPGRHVVHLHSGPAQFVADPDRLLQVIGNLVSNAAAYGDPNSPITVTSIGEKDKFEVSVHNLGPPIPQALLERIFEPMVRGEAGYGVGLGLFIANQIVKAHGGCMEASSTASEGTIFRALFGAAESI